LELEDAMLNQTIAVINDSFWWKLWLTAFLVTSHLTSTDG